MTRPEESFKSSGSSRGTPYAGRVSRRFSATRNALVVTGDFARGTTRVQLLAAPAIDLDTIAVRVSHLPRYRVSPERCLEMHVLVNKRPQPLTEVTMGGSPGVVIEGRTRFATFTPLARRFSELGFQVCGLEVPISEHQMDGVRKFLSIVYQTAQEVRAEAAAQSASSEGAPAGDALPTDEAPAAGAAPAPIKDSETAAPGAPPAASDAARPNSASPSPVSK